MISGSSNICTEINIRLPDGSLHPKERQSVAVSILIKYWGKELAIISRCKRSTTINPERPDWVQKGSNWPQMGQIRDFFRSDFSTFWHCPDLSHLGSIWPTLCPNLASRRHLSDLSYKINREILPPFKIEVSWSTFTFLSGK